MRELIRSAVTLLADWKFDALQLAGNAILLTAAALWLLIPEAHVWQLIFSALSGLVILFLFAWLHCGTLAHGFRPARETMSEDFRHSLRNIPQFVLLLFVLLMLMSYLAGISNHAWQISGYAFTRLPHFLQRSIGENSLHSWIEFKFAILIWFLLPALALPFLSAAASYGFSRANFRAALRTYARWKYWLSVAIAALFGIWLPRTLLNWTPGHGLRREAMSMAMRLVAAYLLIVISWIATSALVGRFLRDATPAEHAGGNAGS